MHEMSSIIHQRGPSVPMTCYFMSFRTEKCRKLLLQRQKCQSQGIDEISIFVYPLVLWCRPYPAVDGYKM